MPEKYLGEVYVFMINESERYISMDGYNRIEDVLRKLISITKGRTRITKACWYVREEEYYGNQWK